MCCRCLSCSNVWWADCCTPTCNPAPWGKFARRLIHAIYSILVTAKKHMVYIPFIVGVVLLLVGQFIITEARNQEAEIIQPLEDIDNSIDDVIEGLNFVTQELPPMTLNYIRNASQIVENEVNSILSLGPLEGTANTVIQAVESSFNQAMAWGEFESAALENAGGPSRISLPNLNLPSISLPSYQLPQPWTSAIPNNIDLSAIRIPERTFSVKDEAAPFVRNVYDIPREIGYVMLQVGSILIAYAGVRMLLSLLWPFTPWPTKSKHQPMEARIIACCLRCGVAVGKSGKNVIRKLMKPYIHVPLVIGAVLILCAVFILFVTADWMDDHMLDPVREIDKLLIIVYNEYNGFIDDLPVEIIDDINTAVSRLSRDAQAAADNELQNGVNFYNTYQTDVQNTINGLISQMRGNSPIFLNPMTLADLQITIPNILIPAIPKPDLEIFKIPTDEWSLEKLMEPWAEEQINELRLVGWDMIEAACVIMFFPALSVLTAMLKPYLWACSPDTAAWLHNPKFHDEESSDDEKKKGADVEMAETSRPSSRQANRG